MKLVVTIPAFNEENTIAEVIGRIPRNIPGVDSIEVVVVDDGSTDQTVELARQMGAHVISHHTNRGVGVAFSTGLWFGLNMGADILVNVDADGQFAPEDIPTLIAPLLSDEADFVTCTRFLRKEFIPVMSKVKIWGNWAVCKMVNLITGGHFTDVACGFRAYKRETALQMNLFGAFTYTQETFIDLASKNVRMVEIPLKVRGEREFGKSRVASNLWRYALLSASIILRAARDMAPLKFFGVISAGMFSMGLTLGAWVLIHFMRTGFTRPYTQFLTGSALFLILGVLLGVVALIADMLGRQRRILEELLYMKKQEILSSGQELKKETTVNTGHLPQKLKGEM